MTYFIIRVPLVKIVKCAKNWTSQIQEYSQLNPTEQNVELHYSWMNDKLKFALCYNPDFVKSSNSISSEKSLDIILMACYA